MHYILISINTFLIWAVFSLRGTKLLYMLWYGVPLLLLCGWSFYFRLQQTPTVRNKTDILTSTLTQNRFLDNNIKRTVKDSKPRTDKPEKENPMAKTYLPHVKGTTDKNIICYRLCVNMVSLLLEKFSRLCLYGQF